MSEVVWEDPPKPLKAPNKWPALLAPLMERPGAWARVREFSSANNAYAVASHLRKGSLARPPGRWEFEAHKTDGGGAVWARYLGPDEDLS